MFNLPEELSVPLGELTGATHRDDVAVMGPDLHHHAGLVPLPRVVTVLVLNKDMIPDLERREATGALGQPLLHVLRQFSQRLEAGPAPHALQYLSCLLLSLS